MRPLRKQRGVTWLRKRLPRRKQTFLSMESVRSVVRRSTRTTTACSIKRTSERNTTTHMGANNNKFYVIQLLEKGGKYYCWTRWGRVGEDGQNALIGPSDLGKALKAFQSKFKDKTKNAWEARSDFKPAAGRYTLIEIDRSVDEDKADEIEAKLKGIDAEAAKVQSKTAKKFAPCKLDAPVEKFMNLIFDEDMFK